MPVAKVVPGFIEPMRCRLVPKLPSGDGWVYEIKWDGYRAIGVKDGSKCRLYSRNGKSFAADFPNLIEELKQLQCRSAVVDGEVVVLDEQGRPSFQSLQKRSTRQARLVLFDVLVLDGRSLLKKPLLERR